MDMYTKARPTDSMTRYLNFGLALGSGLLQFFSEESQTS